MKKFKVEDDDSNIKNQKQGTVKSSPSLNRSRIKLSHIGIILTVFFGVLGLLFQQSAKVIGTNSQITSFEGNSKIEQSSILNNNSNNTSANNSLINSSNNIVLINSNNKITNPSKVINQPPAPQSIPAKQKENIEIDRPIIENQEIQTERPHKKTVAVNSPELYQAIRSKIISGSEFESVEILQRLDYLKQLGQTLDFSDSEQGTLRAEQWMEISSLLTGQIDVWLSKNSIDRFNNRNYFDSMKVLTSQEMTTDAIKSNVAVKIQALKTITASFNKDVEKLHNENKKRRTYNVVISENANLR